MATIVSASLALRACGKFPAIFETANRIASVSFQEGKASITPMGNTELCDFETKGDKIVVYTKMNKLVFTRNDDGTLEGRLKKRKS